MSDMQWRRSNGSTGTYQGPLVDLGHGIPRRMGEHGFRRAIYDLAFGYVSGFPIRDILTFSMRALFPQPVLSVEMQTEEASAEDIYVGTIHLLCPECGDLMPARVSASIGNPDLADVGLATLICEPDMTDIHAHVWTHTS